MCIRDRTTTCGDITIFQINQTTGRLSLVVNAQVTASNGSALTYFPVPANPIDFVLSGQFLLTLTGASAPTSYPYTGGTSVWPYSYPGNGQLTLSQNSVQPLGIHQGNAIVNANSVIYVLDNEPLTITCSSSTCPFPAGTYLSLIHISLRLTAAGSVVPPTGVTINVYVAVPPPRTFTPLGPLTVSVKSSTVSLMALLVAGLMLASPE